MVVGTLMATATVVMATRTEHMTTRGIVTSPALPVLTHMILRAHNRVQCARRGRRGLADVLRLAMMAGADTLATGHRRSRSGPEPVSDFLVLLHSLSLTILQPELVLRLASPSIARFPPWDLETLETGAAQLPGR